MPRCRGSTHHRRIRRCRRRQDPPGRSLCQRRGYRQAGIVLVGDASRPPARSPEPAPTRCSPTSSGCATSTSPHGSRATAWTRTRSRRSTTIRSSRPATLVDGEGLQLRSVSIDDGLYWRAQRWARFIAWFGKARSAAPRRRSARTAEPPRRSLLLVVILVVVIVFIVIIGLSRPRYAACGSGRPRAFGRRRWSRAVPRASRVRSPGRPRSR